MLALFWSSNKWSHKNFWKRNLRSCRGNLSTDVTLTLKVYLNPTIPDTLFSAGKHEQERWTERWARLGPCPQGNTNEFTIQRNKCHKEGADKPELCRKESFWWDECPERTIPGGRDSGNMAGPVQGGWEGGSRRGQLQGPGSRHTVPLRRMRGSRRAWVPAGTSPAFIQGPSQRVPHNQICALHQQVPSRGQCGNLSRVSTSISFNWVIPEQRITNPHKDLCTTSLITTLFITVQSPK